MDGSPHSSRSPSQDLEQLQKALEQVKKGSKGKGPTKEQKEEEAACEKLIAHLEEGKDIRIRKDWKQADVDVINQLQLLTAKPVRRGALLSEGQHPGFVDYSTLLCAPVCPILGCLLASARAEALGARGRPAPWGSPPA